MAQIFRDAFPVFVTAAKGILRVFMALLGCYSKPFYSFDIASLKEISTFIYSLILVAKSILRFSIALFSGSAIPLGCFQANYMRPSKE